MKLKALTGILLAAVMTVGLVSCGDAEEMPEGKYVRVEVGENLSQFRKDIDKAMKKSAKDKNFPIEFDDDSFELTTGTGKSERIYTGTFEIDEKTGEIQFEYETARISTAKKSEAAKVGKEYSDSRAKTILADEMKSMNKTGTYVDIAYPFTIYLDRLRSNIIIPQFVTGGTYELDKQKGREMLYKRGDLLCTELYGVELDGSYKKGKDFTLNFNQYDTLTKDPNSKFDPDRYEKGYYDENGDFVIITKKEELRRDYGSKKIDTTIEFSKGEWEWYTAEGELLNDGEYLESSNYPGLISMFITDDSKMDGDLYSDVCQSGAILLYIDDDGEIFYPAFVKAK